jgi:hypothetical protein
VSLAAESGNCQRRNKNISESSEENRREFMSESFAARGKKCSFASGEEPHRTMRLVNIFFINYEFKVPRIGCTDQLDSFHIKKKQDDNVCKFWII